jgi:ferredoxin
MAKRTFKVWRGNTEGGEFVTFEVDVAPGMVVLDVLHRIQATQANDLALRWNCKAGKCGSCSMEINGKPKLACMSRMNSYSETETITCQPLKTFPVIKDLVTDVQWNYVQNKRIRPFKPRPREADGTHRINPERPWVGPEELPPPAYHKVPVEDYLHPTFLGRRSGVYQASIGCPYGCSFCGVIRIQTGGFSRLSSIEVKPRRHSRSTWLRSSIFANSRGKVRSRSRITGWSFSSAWSVKVIRCPRKSMPGVSVQL